MARDNTRVPFQEDLLRQRVQEWRTLAGEFSAKISELEQDINKSQECADSWKNAAIGWKASYENRGETIELMRSQRRSAERSLEELKNISAARFVEIQELKRELASAKDHLNSDSELGKKYGARIEFLEAHVLNLKKAIDTWKQTVDDWKTIAHRWEDNYSDVNEKYNALRVKQVDKAPKPGGTVNLTVNVDTEDALAKINELLEVAKKIERANNPPLYGAFMPSDT